MDFIKDSKDKAVCIPIVTPRTICGAVSLNNKTALDWGWQGFFAYGAQTTVVVVDPVTLQCAQTLDKHRHHVVSVRWRKTKHYHQTSSPYSLILASADSNGSIIVWDVLEGNSIATFQDGNKPIYDLDWLGGSDGSEHLLVALHPPYSIIVWDTRHSTKVWKKSYTETLMSFHMDPFCADRMTFLCQSCILFVDDFSVQKCPSSNGRRFYISTPKSSPGRNTGSAPLTGSTSSLNEERERTGSFIKKKVREFVVGEVKPKDDFFQLTECLQIEYHKTVRDQLVLIYSKEILILDLTIKMTVGLISMDRSTSPFVQVFPCRYRDALFCLHESGGISVHFRRRLQSSLIIADEKSSSWIDEGGGGGNSPNTDHYEIVYDKKCQSDSLRLSKQHRAVGFSIHPVSEMKIALVLGDGRIIFKEVVTSPGPAVTSAPVKTPLFMPGLPPPVACQTLDLRIADNHFAYSISGNKKSMAPAPKMTIADMVRPAWALPENIKDLTPVQLQILMTGLIPSVAPPPLVIRMCPPLTTRNMSEYVPLLAIGTQHGNVQIFNVASGTLEREFAIHTYPVKGVEWLSLNSILSYSFQPLTNSQGLVRNELVYTDIRTGFTANLRASKSDESSIDAVRVSYLKQYFIVVFKSDPFELWDAKRLIHLRTMSRKLPKISALEWGPASHLKISQRSDSVRSGDGEKETEKQDQAESGEETAPIIKESFVFTDVDGHLYHFFVEGNVIKDGTKVPLYFQMSTITSIAWKSNEIVLSDSDGTLAIWGLKTRVPHHVATHRGWIRKIRFAPGRDNMKLLILCADGVDIWDVREIVLVSQLKSPKDCVKILDIDWGGSDRPILAMKDGCIRIMDMELKLSNSQMNSYHSKDRVTSPYLLGVEGSLNLRSLLIHQTWRQTYSLSFSTEDGFTAEQILSINTWMNQIPADIKEYLTTCESICHRALVVSRLFGDEGESDFWNIATYYLSASFMEKGSGTNSTVSSSNESVELINLGDFSKSCNEGPLENVPPITKETLILTLPLETSYNYLCDSKTFKYSELERLLLHESKGLEGSLRNKLGQDLAVIGERDRAVHLLLDTDSSSEDFYKNYLRACLLSATHHSTQAQSTIKLVATNLISVGKIMEGVEMLCLINKAADACRYLQSYGHWEMSMWLAKCVLNPAESCDIIRRYGLHLINSDKKGLGLCILLSVGDFSGALERLAVQHFHQRAAILLAAVQQYNLLSDVCPHQVDNGAGVEDATGSVTLFDGAKGKSPHIRLVENIYRKYVLFLFGLGNRPAAAHYCKKLGEEGKNLLREINVVI